MNMRATLVLLLVLLVLGGIALMLQDKEEKSRSGPERDVDRSHIRVSLPGPVGPELRAIPRSMYGETVFKDKTHGPSQNPTF